MLEMETEDRMSARARAREGITGRGGDEGDRELGEETPRRLWTGRWGDGSQRPQR